MTNKVSWPPFENSTRSLIPAAFQMSTSDQSRPKRKRRMSKKQKRALGLATDTESDSDSDPSVSESSEEEDHEQEDEGPPTNPPALPRSESTMSIVSQLSVSASTTKAVDSEDKRSKFDERFKTATSTDEEVLSKLFFFYS